MNEEIERAVFRKATGYEIQEITEEYSGDNELLKRKITTKHFPPDMSAVKVYAEMDDDPSRNLASLSDSQLQQLKLRLIAQLNDFTEGEKNEDNYSDYQP